MIAVAQPSLVPQSSSAAQPPSAPQSPSAPQPAPAVAAPLPEQPEPAPTQPQPQPAPTQPQSAQAAPVAQEPLPVISDADIEVLRKLALSGAPSSLPPVTARLFKLSGRLEAEPLLAVSVGDPFFRSVMAGLRVEQHLSERWSVGGHLLGGASLVAAPVQLCGGGPCEGPVAAQLRSTPGDLMAEFGAEAAWRPVYGKLSLLGEKTVHFDLYLALGPELLRERIAPDAASPQSTRWDVGGRVSAGERIYFSNQLSLRLGASEIVYASRVRGNLEAERKLMLEAGLAFFFGAR